MELYVFNSNNYNKNISLKISLVGTTFLLSFLCGNAVPMRSRPTTLPGAPNSAKFRGGCRGPSKIRQKGGCNNFFTFYALKIELFRVFTLSD